MMFLYFVYGLAFFSLGISLWIYPKKDSEYLLANTLWLVALFGIFHGTHEWLQMFLSVRGLPDSLSLHLKAASLFTLPVSFSFLVAFGMAVIRRHGRKHLTAWALPAILFAAWLSVAATGHGNWTNANIWARYLLGVPGIFLSSYALVLQSAVFKNRMPSIAVRMDVAAGAFVVYGICAGLIVPRGNFFPASVVNDAAFFAAAGVPVQLVRTLCALVISYSMITVLRIFDFETRDRLRSLSLKDELTGLLNRRGFITLAEQQFKLAQRLNKKVVLHSGDMDNLKWINDSFGHKEGDAAIIEAARILRESFRQSDCIARFGGDEFVMLQLVEIDGDPDIAATRFQSAVDLFNAKGNRSYKLLMSIGTISSGPEEQVSLAELLDKADKAMYERKRSRQDKARS